MNARSEIPHIPGWVKLVAALILLAGLLLGGALSNPAVLPVQAFNPAGQIAAPGSPSLGSVDGTLASFTALIPQFTMTYLPFLVR